MIDIEGRLPIRVTPGARSEGVMLDDGKVHVKVREVAEAGKATAAAMALVAKALGLAPSAVELLRGATSREKLLRIRG